MSVIADSTTLNYNKTVNVDTLQLAVVSSVSPDLVSHCLLLVTPKIAHLF